LDVRQGHEKKELADVGSGENVGVLRTHFSDGELEHGQQHVACLLDVIHVL
jgi:hypothetical protein